MNLIQISIKRKYTTKDTQIVMPINCHKFYGDITIMLFHAKSLLGTEKVTTTKICQLQFHTAFAHANLVAASNGHQLCFTKNDLDGLDSNEKYPDTFQVVLNLDYKNSQSPAATEECWHNRHEFDQQVCKSSVPDILFASHDEMTACLKSYSNKKKVYSDKSSSSISPPNSNRNDFFLAPKSYERGDSSTSPQSSRSASPMSNNTQYGQQVSTNESVGASSPNVIEANLLGLDLDDDKSGYVPQDSWVSFFFAFLNDLNFEPIVDLIL